MKKILLMDTYSTIHVGNGTLLENTIKLCKQAFGSCEFHIITKDIETNKARYTNLYNPMFGNLWFGLGEIGKIFWAMKQLPFMAAHIINENTVGLSSNKFTFSNYKRKAIDAIEECDICISCGGEILGDTYSSSLPFWLFTYWIAIKKGKKLILFPQSVGPLKKKWTRVLVKLALKNATLYAGRDEASYQTLRNLNFDKDKIMFVPDVAIQQVIGQADIHSYFVNKNKKVIGVTISKPPHHEIGQEIDFVSAVGEQIQKLNPQDYKVLIMPSNFVRNGLSADYKLCLQLKESLLSQFEVAILENRPYFPDEYTGLLSQLHLFVSTRMHVAILATTAFTPTVTINTQHKIRGYMKNIEMEHFCVDYKNIDQIYKLMLEIIDGRVEISCRLQTSIEKIKKEHEPFIQMLKQCCS